MPGGFVLVLVLVLDALVSRMKDEDEDEKSARYRWTRMNRRGESRGSRDGTLSPRLSRTLSKPLGLGKPGASLVLRARGQGLGTRRRDRENPARESNRIKPNQTKSARPSMMPHPKLARARAIPGWRHRASAGRSPGRRGWRFGSCLGPPTAFLTHHPQLHQPIRVFREAGTRFAPLTAMRPGISSVL